MSRGWNRNKSEVPKTVQEKKEEPKLTNEDDSSHNAELDELDRTVADPQGQECFMKYMYANQQENTREIWIEINHYQETADTRTRKKLAHVIYDEFLKPSAFKLPMIDKSLLDGVKAQIDHAAPGLFKEVQEQLFLYQRFILCKQFLASPLYKVYKEEKLIEDAKNPPQSQLEQINLASHGSSSPNNSPHIEKAPKAPLAAVNTTIQKSKPKHAEKGVTKNFLAGFFEMILNRAPNHDNQKDIENELRASSSVSCESFDNAGKLVVEVLQARNLLVADYNGFSDPYCILKYGCEEIRTQIIKKKS